jgi:pSer/pThr/pTyr-binding forkhead associated (FHA) protein
MMSSNGTGTTILRLVMRRGPTPGAIYELNGDEIAVGRGSRNQIVIHDNEVSRDHCRLIRLVDDYEVRDLNSSNGTFVNGQRVVNPIPLQSGALIELGDSITLEYERLRVNLPDLTAEESETEPAAPTRYRYRLMVSAGAGVGRIFMLRDVIVTVGRDLSNDVIIQDPEVSRYHVRLRRVRQGYSIEDMGSTNGTFINGERLEGPRVLRQHDLIKLGGTVQFQFVQEPIEEDEEDTGTLSDPQGGVSALEGGRATAESRKVELARDDTLHGGIIRGVRSQIKTSRLGTGLEPGTLHDHIFIAYARDDWETIIAQLTLSLQDAGINTWVDQYLVRGSDDWRAAIEQALVECQTMIVVASDAALADPYVRMAFRHFAKRERAQIFVLNAGAHSLPDELANRRMITLDPHSPRRTFHKMLFEILQLRP